MPLDQPQEEKEMSFLEHLEELRWHVVRSLIAIVVFMIFAFVNIEWIFTNILFAPGRVDFPTFVWLCKLGHWVGSPDAFCVEQIPFKVQSRLMTGQFTMSITASFVIGLVIVFLNWLWPENSSLMLAALMSRERVARRRRSETGV